MPDLLLMLHLTASPTPLLRGQPEETPMALFARALARWPFLPVTHISCDGMLLGHFQPPVQAAEDNPTPAPPPRKKRKQGYAERYRQHWIDKDNAKKSQ